MQEIKFFLDSLHQHNDEETAIIVEGKCDVAALKTISCQNLFEINTELYLLAEKVSQQFKRVIILTDLDKEGKKLCATLKKIFSQLGVHIINEPRELLFKTQLCQIEGLPKYMERHE